MIRINDDWIVDVDDYQYILKQDMHRTTSRKQKNGTVNDDEVYITRGYFGTLDKALERLGEEMVREKLKAGSPSLQEAVHTIRECRDEWRRLVEEVTRT
jgi:hypothetical protein